MTGCGSLVLTNVTLPDGRIKDISLGDGTVSHIGAGLVHENVINCSGQLVLPGATDIHVHMRGGAQSAKEDWRSGSQSAIAGGVTLVVDQPNTVPPLTTTERFARRVQEARAHTACHFAINSAVTANTDLNAMWAAGAMNFGETFYGPSSYGETISTPALELALIRIRALGGLATIHAEKIAPVLAGDLAGHARTRPPQGEVEAIRAVLHRNNTGCRLHFCHLSTAAAVDVAGHSSVEVTPHHLFLSAESFRNPADTTGKVNPPLRTERDRKALWARWDRIDIIASDHAPHTGTEKRLPFEGAPAGIPGVETMMPLLVAEVIEKNISLPSLIRKTSERPASLLGIRKSGFDIGDRADFALYPKTPVRITSDSLHSKCGWTPYENFSAVFPRIVIINGSVSYQEGEFLKGSPQWFPGRGYKKTKPPTR
jgi:dihydroorotase